MHKKSCLDCAFCLRRKDYWINLYPSSKASHWRHSEYNLTKREISELRNGSASFLFEDKQKQDKWIVEYKKREREAEQKKLERELKEARQTNNFSATIVAKLPFSKLNDFFRKKYDRYKEFGMEEMPKVPDHDFLACWKEQWSSDNNTEILKTLKSRKCKFFYPLNEKGEKTLSACNEEVLIRMDNKKFWKGILCGALTTICGGALLRILG